MNATFLFYCFYQVSPGKNRDSSPLDEKKTRRPYYRTPRQSAKKIASRLKISVSVIFRNVSGKRC